MRLAPLLVLLSPLSANAAVKSACDLVTLTEAATLTGHPMRQAIGQDVACLYAAVAGPQTVQVSRMAGSNASEAQQMIDMQLKPTPSSIPGHFLKEAVPGLGDSAAFVYTTGSSSGGTATLSVRSGSTVFMLVVNPGGTPPAATMKDATMQQMKKILSRM